MSKLVGIMRAEVYSPRSNDTAIMESVTHLLMLRRHHVEIVSETDVDRFPQRANLYFSMARSPEALAALDGRCVVNAPQGVRNCRREALTALMQTNRVPMPKTVLMDTASSEFTLPSGPLWLKRADGWSMSADDVCQVHNEGELKAALLGFNKRGIAAVVASEHLTGDLVKFYGVKDTGFFYWYYPEGEGRFGHERENGLTRGYTFSATALNHEAERLAGLIGIDIYGGDAVIDERGQFKLIDFNDWPSFSRCIGDAATAIADLLETHLDDGI
jgi:glutathione synthase/RimK-type ligase-like ATP-grasp enzyme